MIERNIDCHFTILQTYMTTHNSSCDACYSHGVQSRRASENTPISPVLLLAMCERYASHSAGRQCDSHECGPYVLHMQTQLCAYVIAYVRENPHVCVHHACTVRTFCDRRRRGVTKQ